MAVSMSSGGYSRKPAWEEVASSRTCYRSGGLYILFLVNILSARSLNSRCAFRLAVIRPTTTTAPPQLLQVTLSVVSHYLEHQALRDFIDTFWRGTWMSDDVCHPITMHFKANPLESRDNSFASSKSLPCVRSIVKSRLTFQRI